MDPQVRLDWFTAYLDTVEHDVLKEIYDEVSQVLDSAYPDVHVWEYHKIWGQRGDISVPGNEYDDICDLVHNAVRTVIGEYPPSFLKGSRECTIVFVGGHIEIEHITMSDESMVHLKFYVFRSKHVTSEAKVGVNGLEQLELADDCYETIFEMLVSEFGDNAIGRLDDAWEEEFDTMLVHEQKRGMRKPSNRSTIEHITELVKNTVHMVYGTTPNISTREPSYENDYMAWVEASDIWVKIYVYNHGTIGVCVSKPASAWA